MIKFFITQEGEYNSQEMREIFKNDPAANHYIILSPPNEDKFFLMHPKFTGHPPRLLTKHRLLECHKKSLLMHNIIVLESEAPTKEKRYWHSKGAACFYAKICDLPDFELDRDNIDLGRFYDWVDSKIAEGDSKQYVCFSESERDKIINEIIQDTLCEK